MPPVGSLCSYSPSHLPWLCCASLKVSTRGVAAAATGATKPLAQSQVAPSAGLDRPVVYFVNESAAVNSVTEQFSFRLTAEPLLKDFRKLTVLLDGG